MKPLLLCLGIILSTTLIAQSETCSHKIFDLEEVAQFEEAINTPTLNKSNNTCNKIRTVVHVIYDSQSPTESASGFISREQVMSQIRITNQFFRNDSLMHDPDNNSLGYELVLAKSDPLGNPTTGIVFHDGVELFGPAWSTYGLKNDNPNAVSESVVANELAWGLDHEGKRYLNTYVVSKIDGSAGGGTQAYAYFPTPNVVYGNYNLFNAFGAEQLEDEYEQNFNLKSYTDLGLTWTHELLHNFAIFHTFQGNSCAAETNPNLQGDRVTDTPPQTKGLGCTGSCGFLSYNVMDYISQGCKTLITEGQVNRAHLAIDNNLQLYLVCNPTDNTPCDNSESHETISACNSYFWNGNEYTESGNYSAGPFENAQGCDSTAYLYLTISPSSSTSESVTACGSYYWDGQTLTDSGTYIREFENEYGCESVETLELTISYQDGDFNDDGFINILDVSEFGQKFGCTQGDACYDSGFDLNCDGLLNIQDVSILSSQF